MTSHTTPSPSEPSPPLKPVFFDVLLALAAGERHGYAIVREIAGRAGRRVEPANLYRTLRVLLDKGLVEESSRRPAPDLDDARRRYYRITRLGRQAAAAETERMRALVEEAQARRLAKARG